MLGKDWRNKVWGKINGPWDLLIIGGGITGAGLFRMAAKAGLKTLLVDSNDFAFGTSSRSSKLIHGGLRYIKNGQYNVTFESVRERERLLMEAPGLVTPLEFIFPIYEKYHTAPWQIGYSLGIYDLFGLKKAHGRLSTNELIIKAPTLTKSGLSFSYYYYDAVVDDARLVLRNIQEGIALGGIALNYAKVEKLLLDNHGQVCGAVIIENDLVSEPFSKEITARVVVNATGPWTDNLRSQVSEQKIIRKLRGSHIQFTHDRFPINCGFSIIHPVDKRSLFVLPWEGVTVVGTTDLDHPNELEKQSPEPFMTKEEGEYLLLAANHFFPQYALSSKDIISSFSGLRPVLRSDEADPSKASREHSLLEEKGLITITGGKLTTYRKMAYEVMQKVQIKLNRKLILNQKEKILNPVRNINIAKYPEHALHRWSGRFGDELPIFLDSIRTEENNLIPTTTAYWAEMRWAARNEAIVHLDDLLLRRVRLGLLLPEGGLQLTDMIRKITQEELNWDNIRWEKELQRYKTNWNKCYYLAN
jgi:glycerol-3-phosphate dehydrogenase